MKAITYTRVSTVDQGKSGLGLQAQLDAVTKFCTAENIEVAGHYQETETGKGFDALNKRPQLAKALAYAKKEGAYLNVIKLSRWLRSCTVILFWGKKTMTLMKLLKRNTYKPGMLN